MAQVRILKSWGELYRIITNSGEIIALFGVLDAFCFWFCVLCSLYIYLFVVFDPSPFPAPVSWGLNVIERRGQRRVRGLERGKLSSREVGVLMVWRGVALLCCLVAAVSAKTSKPHVSRKGNSNPIDGLPSVYVTLMI